MPQQTVDIQRPKYGARRGATLVECAITLPVVLLVLFATLDLGLATTRYNALAEVSRRIARNAILRGSTVPDTSTIWGPDEFTGTVADGSEIVTSAKNMIPTMTDSDVTVRVTWPEGDNSPRDPVQVEVSYEHEPLLPGLFPWGTLDLRSVTTMNIVN